MDLNDDITAIILSYLDITEYLSCEKIHLFNSLNVQSPEQILKLWLKNSKCEKIFKHTYFEKKVNGKLHCEDGPAIEWTNGGKSWWVNDKKHRLDGPAVELYGTKEWWVNGRKHRTNGPAI